MNISTIKRKNKLSNNDDVQYWKNRANEFEQKLRILANEKVIVHNDKMNVARFDIVRILTKNLDTQIRTMCFIDSIIDEGLKSSVLITIQKLKQEMNIEFENGLFYYYSKNGDKLIVDGRDYSEINGYNKDWMK